MFERIVVPLDGSLTAEAVLPQVRRVLYRKDSEVILLRAVAVPSLENGIMIAEAQLGAAREYLLAKQEALERDGVRVKSIARIGSPLGTILEVVEQEKATLVAMATHGSGGVARLLLGSTAEALMRDCPVPILLVRPFWSYEIAPAGAPEQKPIRNLLLPVDGSERALAALPGVVALAELFDTRVVLLRVLGEKESEAEAGRELQALAKALGRKGVEAETLLRKGKPVEQILKAAAEPGIDLIAMTTHGRSGLARMLMGSVSEAVLRRAESPLLITRSAKPEAAKARRLKSKV